MIELRNVSFTYAGSNRRVLQNLSLEIARGESVGIIGPTGSGKSTLCYLFNGLIPHHFSGKFQGEVLVSERNVIKETIESMSQIVGYMLQEPSLQIASPFVESEITFGMENFAVPVDQMDKRLNEIIAELGLEHLRYRATADLSEGEKQKVVLASILAMDPSILVLDESSSMVDSTSKNDLVKILTALKKQQRTLIIIDHDLDFLAKIVDRVILINNGSIIIDGATDSVLTNNRLLIENGLIPPIFPDLFDIFQEKKLLDDPLPLSLESARKIVQKWLP